MPEIERQHRPNAHYIGIDGGGTKTEAVLIDARGNETGRAKAGPANLHSAGPERAEASLRHVIQQLLSSAGLDESDIAGVGLGMAGIARPADQDRMHAILSRILCVSRTVLTHDAETALIGGAGRRYGVVLIAGTGAIAYGVNADGETRRADGWGYLLGDEGSAYWIGRAGLRAAMRAGDGRGPDTDLEHLLVSRLGLDNIRQLVTHVYAEGFGVAHVAALAPWVQHAAQDGDAVSRHIVQQAAGHLARAVRAVICGLDMAAQTFEIVLTGGVLAAKGPIWDALCTALGEIAPRAQAIEPRHDAAYGAAWLARQTEESK